MGNGRGLIPTDGRQLRDLRSYVDERSGIVETFLETRIEPISAFALVSTPLEHRDNGPWVISPSLGPEHGNLRRLETLVARSLAAAGHPCIRIRPDLHPIDGATGEIDLDVQIDTVRRASELIEAETGKPSVGVVGTLFGGTVAALFADRTELPGLALIEPATRGRTYLREIMRRQAVAELMETVESGRPKKSTEVEVASDGATLLDQLSASGQVTTRGVRLTRDEFGRISAVALDRDLQHFQGSSLIVGISPTETVSPGLQRLSVHLEELGGNVSVQVLSDPLSAPFGEYYFRNDGPVRVDTRLALDRRIAEVTTTWVSTTFGDG